MNLSILILTLLIASDVESACNSVSYYATIQLKSVQYYKYSNNDDCTINIIPYILYQRGYYLEVTWNYFDIEGYLPYCKDYIEVFISRSKSTIGKYCSGNTDSSKLFKMYSSDGYAVIRFKSDNSITKGGFKFSYQLKSIQSKYIGQYGGSTCYYSKYSEYSRRLYSSGWPKGYAKGKGYCYFTINVPEGKEARVIIMDLDLRKIYSTCDDRNDYFQLKGSKALYKTRSSIMSLAQSVTSKHCGTYKPGYFTSKQTYLYLFINKPLGSYPFYSKRGIMMGYIHYDLKKFDDKNKSGGNKTSDDNKKSSSKTKSLWEIVGGSLGGFTLITVVGIVAAIIKRKEDGACCEFEDIHINICNK